MRSLGYNFVIGRFHRDTELPRCVGSGNPLFETAVGAELDVALPFWLIW